MEQHLVYWHRVYIKNGIESSLFAYIDVLMGVQLSEGKGCDPINRFNPAIYMCLSQART